MAVRCDYCDGLAKLANGSEVYPHRPDLKNQQFWYCVRCSAWVGVHRGTKKPLGRLATAGLRRLKMAAHAAFDPIWRTGRKTRSGAYAWLSSAMGLPPEKTHIGMFDEDQCRKVAELANAFMSANGRPTHKKGSKRGSTYMGRTPCKVYFDATVDPPVRIELAERDWIG